MKSITISLRTVAIVVAVLVLSSLTSAVVANSEPTEHQVEIRNLTYTPSVLNVSPGDTIIWTNYDFVPHTVTADDESWDSGLIEANGKWQIVVTKDMYESYFCRFHPNMKAGVEVGK